MQRICRVISKRGSLGWLEKYIYHLIFWISLSIILKKITEMAKFYSQLEIMYESLDLEDWDDFLLMNLIVII